MALEHRLLLFSAVPQPDESFLGYLLRLTELNCYTSPSWILQMAELSTHVGSTAFVFNDSQNLAPLARLTGVNKVKLAELIYRTADTTRRKMGNYLMFGSVITQYLIRPDRPKICSYCIRESGYARKMWEFIPVTVCPVHKCLLLDECPNCQTRISWNRESISQCRCELDWCGYQPLTIGEQELQVTEQIYRLCNLISAKDKIIKCQSNPNPLYKLDLQHFLSAIIFVASQYGGFIDTKGKFIVSLRRNAEIHMLLYKAFSAFDDWPKNFYSFLDWRRAQTPNKKFAYGLRREFGEYKSVLYAQLSSKHLDFMRRAFEDYLTTQWQGGYLSHMRRLSPSARRNAKYLPMKEAQLLLRTSYIYELIKSGRLKAVVAQQGNRRFVLIERASLNNFRHALKRALSLTQLCNLLALSSARIRELVKAGIINPLRGPAVDGLTTWKFNNTEARKLLEIFKEKTIAVTNTRARKELTFREVLVKFDYYGVVFSRLVQAVLSEEIRPSRINNKKGLTKFFFLDEQITNFIRYESQLQGEEAYTVGEVTKLLKSSKRVIWFLIRNGFIQAQKLSHLSSAGLIIKKSELERFNSTFLIAKDIASQLGTNPRYICELLITHGIQPVSSRTIHRSPLIIFKKSDLDGIDLASLVSISKSEARIVLPCPFKKKEAVTLNEIQAADALGVDVDVIEQLVERGVLKLHRYRRPSREGAEKYCFPARTVEKWKGQSISCTDVVAFLIAAKMLGLGPDNFYKKYVRTGRLKAVITGNNVASITSC